MFVIEEPAFAFDAAAVAGQRAIGADHAMAGYDDGDGIGTIGRADCPDSGRMTDPLCEPAVRRCRTAGDLAQRLPDFALKGRAAGGSGNAVNGA